MQPNIIVLKFSQYFTKFHSQEARGLLNFYVTTLVNDEMSSGSNKKKGHRRCVINSYYVLSVGVQQQQFLKYKYCHLQSCPIRNGASVYSEFNDKLVTF